MKLVLLVIVILVAFASSYEDTAGLIIGGSDATIEEFPYMAGVNNMGLFNCGGSIISARSVLTVSTQNSHYVRFLYLKNLKGGALHFDKLRRINFRIGRLFKTSRTRRCHPQSCSRLDSSRLQILREFRSFHNASWHRRHSNFESDPLRANRSNDSIGNWICSSDISSAFDWLGIDWTCEIVS